MQRTTQLSNVNHQIAKSSHKITLGDAHKILIGSVQVNSYVKNRAAEQLCACGFDIDELKKLDSFQFAQLVGDLFDSPIEEHIAITRIKSAVNNITFSTVSEITLRLNKTTPFTLFKLHLCARTNNSKYSFMSSKLLADYSSQTIETILAATHPPTSYEQLSTLPIEKGDDYFGRSFNSPILYQSSSDTIADLHAAIYGTTNIHKAAATVDLTEKELTRFLTLLEISYFDLIRISPSVMEKLAGIKYRTPIANLCLTQLTPKPLEHFTLAELHRHIQQSHSIDTLLKTMKCNVTDFFRFLAKQGLALTLENFIYCSRTRLAAYTGKDYRTLFQFLSYPNQIIEQRLFLPTCNDLPSAINQFHEVVNQRNLADLHKYWQSPLVQTYYSGKLITGVILGTPIPQLILPMELLVTLKIINNIDIELTTQIINNINNADLVNAVHFLLSISSDDPNTEQLKAALIARHEMVLQSFAHIFQFFPPLTELRQQDACYYVNLPRNLEPLLKETFNYSNLGIVTMLHRGHDLTLVIHAEKFNYLLQKITILPKHQETGSVYCELPKPPLSTNCFRITKELMELLLRYQNFHEIGITSITFNPTDSKPYSIVFDVACYQKWLDQIPQPQKNNHATLAQLSIFVNQLNTPLAQHGHTHDQAPPFTLDELEGYLFNP